MLPFDPRGKTNRALLVGVSEYDLTEPPHGVPGDLPAVKHNLQRMHDVLTRGGVFGERDVTVARSPSLDEFGRALRRTAEEAEGLLLLYFAGHGAIPSAGDELFLQMRNASVVAGGHAVFPGAETFSTLLTVLATSRARRIVVILDCCFAGNAAWIWETFYDKRRVLLLMGVQANHRIDAGDPKTPTPYTDALAALLEEGGTGLPDLADRLRERMTALGHRTERGEPWEPQFRAERDMDVLLTAEETLDERGTGGEDRDSGNGGATREAEGERDGEGTRGAGGKRDGGANREAEGERDGEGTRGAGGKRDGGATREAGGKRDGEANREAGGKRDGGGQREDESGNADTRARLAAFLGSARALVARPGRLRPHGPGRGLRRAVIRPAVPLLLAAGLLGLSVLVLLRFTGGDGTTCAPPLELRVLADPDLEPTVRAAADAYLTSRENTTGDGCRRTGITVYSAGSSDVVAALRGHTGAWQQPQDEDTNPQRDIGPQPDVWIPASRAGVDRARAGQDTDAVADLEADEDPLAYSPVVLAVPHQMGSDAVAARVDHPLNTLIDRLTEENEDAAVRRPDPEFTDVGLLATVGLYGADARAVARGERQVAQPGPPSPTAAELLCVLPDEDAVDHRTAALVPEFLLRSGVDCDRTTRSPRYAQYPEDVPGVEPVFVRVRWQGADRDEAARDASAAGFRAWLTGRQGRAVFARDGFRSAYDRELLDREHPAGGVLAAPYPLDQSAGRKAMEEALRRYQEAGGPGRVLFLLDSSGSMAGLWEGPSGGPGLLRQSLGGLGREDEYGVWTVADGEDRPYGTLLPLGRQRRADAEHAVGTARVRDAEADPAAALLAALDEMEELGDGRPRLVVHLTDGEDNDRLTGDRLETVLARARSAGVPVTVVSLESGGCDTDRPDRRIADESGGRCLDTGDDLGAALHDEVARTGTGED